MTMRACEQNRTAICYQDLPVCFIGTGGGLTSGGGSTHNAMEDISIMKSMVNMTVLSIGDPNMVRDIMILSMTYPHPLYLRLAQGKKDRMLYEPGKYEYKIGMGLTARKGKDATIIATGYLITEAIKALDILEKEGLDVGILNMCTVKPLDEEAIIRVAEQTRAIVTAENGSIVGGMGDGVAAVLGEYAPAALVRVGVEDEFSQSARLSADVDELKDLFGLGAKDIAIAVKEAIAKREQFKLVRK